LKGTKDNGVNQLTKNTKIPVCGWTVDKDKTSNQTMDEEMKMWKKLGRLPLQSIDSNMKMFVQKYIDLSGIIS